MSCMSAQIQTPQSYFCPGKPCLMAENAYLGVTLQPLNISIQLTSPNLKTQLQPQGCWVTRPGTGCRMVIHITCLNPQGGTKEIAEQQESEVTVLGTPRPQGHLRKLGLGVPWQLLLSP